MSNLKLVLSDDELLQHKLKSAITKADGESNMLDILGASLSIMKAVNDDLYQRETILLMLEKSDILSVSKIVQRKAQAIEQTAQKTHDAEIREQVIKEIEAKQAEVAQEPKSGIQQLLESTNNRYKQQGNGGLSDRQITQFMTGYDRCELSHKEYALKTRLGKIEGAGQPIGYVLNFIEYIEQHQRLNQ